MRFQNTSLIRTYFLCKGVNYKRTTMRSDVPRRFSRPGHKSPGKQLNDFHNTAGIYLNNTKMSGNLNNVNHFFRQKIQPLPKTPPNPLLATVGQNKFEN